MISHVVKRYCLIPMSIFLISCNEESLKDEYTNDVCGVAASQFEINFTPFSPNSSTPVTDTGTLASAISFEDSRLISTSIPIPSNPTGGSLSLPLSVTISDNSSSHIQITPSGLPSGYHISSVMVQFAGTSQHFLIPIDPDAADIAAAVAAVKAQQSLISDDEAAAAQVFADAGGVTIKLSGPSSGSSGTPLIQGTVPGEIVVSSSLSVAAFLSPDNATDPDYSQDTWDGIDDSTYWTSTTTMGTTAVFVGTGTFQTSLTWSTGITDGTGTSSDLLAVDLDLHITEPDTTEIYFSNKTSDSSGELDTDNVLGFGPENIVYTEDPPEGSYLIEVVYFDNGTSNLIPTNWTVSVTACNSSQTYTGYITVKTTPRTVVQFTIETGCTLPNPEDLDPIITLDLPPVPNIWEQSELCSADAAE